MKNLWGQKKKADWISYQRRARWAVIWDLVFLTLFLAAVGMFALMSFEN